MEDLTDRSSQPHHIPRLTHAEVIEKILSLQKNYHFGPAKIAIHLQQKDDIQISHSEVWRILKRLNVSRLPASPRDKRHERR